MRVPRQSFGVTLFVALVCLILRASPVDDGVHEHVFRNNAIGLTYTIPENLFPKSESEIRAAGIHLDPTGREHIVLAMWNTPERSGIPRIAFLYDTKIRPTNLSRKEIATGWIESMKRTMKDDPNVKMSEPKTVSFGGIIVWRVDYWQGHGYVLPYNSAIVIPLTDRKLLAIQLNATSQIELDTEVESLRELRFDK
jgi:hypothetical protein